MNNRQVTLLWIIALALGGGVAFTKFGQKQSIAATTARVAGQTLLESFPANDVAAVEIQGAGNTTNLVKKDGKWVLTQRDDYPANVTTLNDFIRTLEELKVTQGIQAGPSFAPRFGLDESATSADKRGVTATFKGAGGEELVKVSIDRRAAPENPASPYGGAPNGRFIRNHRDSTGIYRVNEAFASLSEDPKRWLAENFVQIEKIKAVSVTQPDKADVAWKLARDTEDGAFTLTGAAAGETLDTAATDPLKSVFSYARFEDVIPAAKTAERIQPTGKRIASIETVEGFTYTITFTPLKPAATPPPVPNPASPQPPAATDNFAVTVAVTAELPKERKKAEGEKPEDAKTKDAAFTERLKTLSERLDKEKALAGRTFEVGKFTLEPLLKERSALLKKDAPATTTPPAGSLSPTAPRPPIGTLPQPGNPPPAVRRPIEAVTPAVAIPPLPDDSKDAKDATPEPAKEAAPKEAAPAAPKDAAPAAPKDAAPEAPKDAAPAAPKDAAPAAPEPAK